MDWVKWFCEWAERDRFQEEVEIFEAEFERTIASHSHMAQVWMELADRCTHPGAAAYARKKVWMYHRLQADCESVYKAAKEKARYTVEY